MTTNQSYQTELTTAQHRLAQAEEQSQLQQRKLVEAQQGLGTRESQWKLRVDEAQLATQAAEAQLTAARAELAARTAEVTRMQQAERKKASEPPPVWICHRIIRLDRCISV